MTRQVPTSPETLPLPTVALMVTRRCNMTCRHCSVESRPGIARQPSEKELLRYVREAADAGARSVLFTGGEPMLREDVVLKLMRECRRRGVSSRMATNGFWGQQPVAARRRLEALRRAGLTGLNVSYDRYHAEFQGPEPVLNIARAAEALGFTINITVTRLADDSELEQIVAPFRDLRGVRLRFYDVQPVGFAQHLELKSLRSETDGFCSACEAPAITDDGRVTACNGPSYFADSSSPLSLGKLNEFSVKDLAKLHRSDPILETIRTFGPARLRDELKSMAGFENFPFKAQYHGMCELCLQITNNRQAVEALRERLSSPKSVADRLAMRQVMTSNRRAGGTLNQRFVNGVGASRLFFRAATSETRWTADSRKVLGRADLDWNQQLNYLIQCGLARPMLPALNDEELVRWAPKFFLDRLRQRAIQDERLELTQRDVLRRVATVLSAIDARGVLLKGVARLAVDLDAGNLKGARPPGDLDIYVDHHHAGRAQRRLIEAGFTASDAGDPHHHHLARLRFRGVCVEIHTRIAPAYFGLPEQPMLSNTRSIRYEEFDCLQTLNPEGMLLHACIHAANHSFVSGLRTGWDLHWILGRFPNLDWHQVVSWAQSAKLSRGFWVPARVLSEELGIPIPSEVLRLAPQDKRQRYLERMARQLMNDTVKTDRSIIFSLLLHDSMFGLSKYALGKLRAQRRAGEPSFRRVCREICRALTRWRNARRVYTSK